MLHVQCSQPEVIIRPETVVHCLSMGGLSRQSLLVSEVTASVYCITASSVAGLKRHIEPTHSAHRANCKPVVSRLHILQMLAANDNDDIQWTRSCLIEIWLKRSLVSMLCDAKAPKCVQRSKRELQTVR